MKKTMNKKALLAGLVCTSVLTGGTIAFAEESVGEFALDTMVVTATRKIVTEKFEYNQPEYQHAGIFPIVQVLIIVGIAVYSFIKVY